MKKVLLASLGLCLSAGLVWGASGDIRNSAHDLSSTSTYTRQNGIGEQHYETDFDRICAFCHTPHKGDLTVTNAPLWNRTNPAVGGYSYYDSATLTTEAKNHDDAAGSDLPLCMSCHDGSSLAAALKNPVKGLPTVGTSIADIGAGSTGLLLDGVNSLTNDHPVGFEYDLAEGDAAESGLNTLAVAKGNGAAFFGAGANEMWCSSCHAVHDPGTVGGDDEPFLRIANNASSLCLACHNK